MLFSVTLLTFLESEIIVFYLEVFAFLLGLRITFIFDETGREIFLLGFYDAVHFRLNVF